MFSGLFGKKNNNISVEELVERINNKEDLVILDVRNRDETEGPLGKIKGSVNIAVDQLSKKLPELEKYKDKEIAVICHSGGRSAMATMLLSKAGFKPVNVTGGMLQYRMKFGNN